MRTKSLITQNIKIGKLIFHSFQYIAHLSKCKYGYIWGGGGLHIVNWENPKYNVLKIKILDWKLGPRVSNTLLSLFISIWYCLIIIYKFICLEETIREKCFAMKDAVTRLHKHTLVVIRREQSRCENEVDVNLLTRCQS